MTRLTRTTARPRRPAGPVTALAILLVVGIVVPAALQAGQEKTGRTEAAPSTDPRVLPGIVVERADPAPRISMSLKDAELTEVLRSFARILDLDIVFAGDLEGRVTVELHDVRIDDALRVILKTHGLAADLSLASHEPTPPGRIVVQRKKP